MVAAVASLSITTGTPNRRCSRSRRGTSTSGRFTDSTTCPAAKSTMDATPTPMPSTRPEPCSRSAMQVTMPSRQARIEWASVSTVYRSRITGVSRAAGVPAEIDGRRPRSSAAAILVPPMSTPMTVRSALMTPPGLPRSYTRPSLSTTVSGATWSRLLSAPTCILCSSLSEGAETDKSRRLGSILVLHEQAAEVGGTCGGGGLRQTEQRRTMCPRASPRVAGCRPLAASQDAHCP